MNTISSSSLLAKSARHICNVLAGKKELMSTFNLRKMFSLDVFLVKFAGFFFGFFP